MTVYYHLVKDKQKVEFNSYSYLSAVILLVYTRSKTYSQFSLLYVFITDRGVELKRSGACQRGGEVNYMFFSFVQIF